MTSNKEMHARNALIRMLIIGKKLSVSIWATHIEFTEATTNNAITQKFKGSFTKRSITLGEYLVEANSTIIAITVMVIARMAGVTWVSPPNMLESVLGFSLKR
jgi:hypothetical protein